jgi:predicted small secreted protein
MRILLSAVAICVTCLALNACNTVDGVGEDVQAGGHAVSTGAQKVQSKL